MCITEFVNGLIRTNKIIRTFPRRQKNIHNVRTMQNPYCCHFFCGDSVEGSKRTYALRQLKRLLRAAELRWAWR